MNRLRLKNALSATPRQLPLSVLAIMQAYRNALRKGLLISSVQGYVLLYILKGQEVVAAAGYRIFTMLYAGKLLYIDDLVTLESHKGKGYASTLLQYLYGLARVSTIAIRYN